MKRVVVIKAGSWWDLSPTERVGLRRWMKENGLEADDIPAGEEVVVEDGHIVHWAIQRDEKGKVRTERDDQGQLRVLAEERRTPLITAPPGLAPIA